MGGMDFKDLANFNDALLAKQAWRLLHQKDSLFYRVFKARFFPNCSILEAPNSNTGSYVWSSILKGQDLLLKGVRQRVGCGEEISVWNDAWLPSPTQTQVNSHVVQGFEDIKVSELIDPVTHKQDQNLLHGLFTPHEAKLIANIPLCLNKVEDVVVWPFTLSGYYTIKSGSKFLADEQFRSQQPSSTPNDNGLWKMIQGLSVPPKVRYFLWRACQNALPIKYNLRRRHILTEDTCEACKVEVEDIYHALWGCNQLSQKWGSIPSFSYRQSKTFSSIREVLTFTYEEQKNVELMASVIWTIWHRRNQI